MKNIYSIKLTCILACAAYFSFLNIASGTGVDTLKLKFFIEGYYYGGGVMAQVLYDQGVDTDAMSTNVDTVLIELHQPAHVSTIAQSFKGILQFDGMLNCTFPDSVTGHAYYIVIKYRNTLETWSANAITMRDTITYDFTTAASKAYSNNMTNYYSDGPWLIYSGDVTD